jgi:hypothetical protein
MELIEEINASELRVRHLRSGYSGVMSKTFLRMDVGTPLRLAVSDRGIVQLSYAIQCTRCLSYST